MPRMLGDVAFAVLPETSLFRTQLDAQMKKALAGASADIPVRADFAEFSTAAGIGLKKALQDISRKVDATVQIRPDTTAFRSTAGDALRKALAGIAEKTSATRDVTRTLTPALDQASDSAAKYAASFAILRAALGNFDSEIPKSQSFLRTLSFGLKALGIDADRALASIGGGGGKFRDFNTAAGGAGRGLFGFGYILRGTIGYVKIWHVVLSAVIETIILLTAVTAAATVAALAMAPVIEDLTTNLKAMHTVNEALHQDIGPLTGQIHNLGAAMAPQVVELYGAALGVVGGKMGLLNQFGPKTVTLLDDLAAKFTIWVQAQQSGGKIIQSGIGYFTQLAHIFGSLGQAIANLIKADPGILKMLLLLLQGFAGVLNVVSRLPVPLLTVALALHGAWIWGNVLARVLVGIYDSAKKAALGLYALRLNPLLWVGVAAAALAYLAYESLQADKSTKTFIDNLNSGLQKLTASQAILEISADIQLVNNRISDVSKTLDTSRPVILGTAYTFNSLKEGLGGLKDIVYSSDIPGGFRKIWDAISGRQAQKAANDFRDLNIELAQLNKDQQTLFAATGYVISQKYAPDVAHAFALIDLAGVKAGDSMDIVKAKIDNLVRGYEALVGKGGVLNNSLNAVTFQALQQQSQIDALTGAWDAFFNTVTGGISGFLNFAQAMQSMGKLLPNNAKAAQQLATAQGRVASAQDRLNKLLSSGGPSASAAASATDRLRAAQDHLNILQKSGHATALQLQSATDRVTAAQDHLNAINKTAGPTTLAVIAATDRLRAAQLNLQQVQATGVASFTGLNANSLQLRQSFIQAANAAHAQQDALLKLSSAAGLGAAGTALVQRATKDMIQVMLPAAKTSGELTTVLYLLAQQGGYQGANSFKELSKWVGKTKNPMQDLQKVTDKLTTAAANLSQDVKDLSVALGRTLNDAMAAAIFQASGGQKVFDDFADKLVHTGLASDQTRTAGVKLATELYSLTGNVKDAHSEFVAFTEKALKVNAAQAEDLWKRVYPGLQKEIDSLHGTKLPVQVIISGHGTIKSIISGFATQLPTGKLTLGLAGGGRLPGYGGGDRVPAMLEPGEFVINKVSAAKFGYGMLGKINRMAAGGVIGDISTAEAWSGKQGTTFAATAGTVFARRAITEFQKASTAAISMNAGLGSLPFTPGPVSGSAAVAQAFARSILWSYGWKANQWPFELALWNRESGWNAYAQNPTSGAAGIPQNINGWAAYKPGDYQSQIRWGDSYIWARYGTPQRAWAHEVNFGWYDSGGILKPGANLMWNGTGRNEHLVPAQSGEVHIHLHNHGVIGSDQEMRRWLARNIDELARTGRLSYAIRRSSSA